MHNPLERIKTGMKVYDNAQHEIGTVEYIKFGEENPANAVPASAGVSPIVRQDAPSSLVENVFEVFERDEMPEELKSRLLREGFIRMDAHGLFNADRYIFPDQIQSSSSDRVVLKVSKDTLIKRN